MKAYLASLLNHKLTKNISSLLFIQVANFIIPLLIIPYVTRVVGIENYGRLEYATIFILYFTVAINYGFNITITREISINRDSLEKLNKIVSKTYCAKLLLLCISTIIFYIFLKWDDSLQDITKLLWVTFLINIGHFIFPLWYYLGIEKIAKIAYINFFVKIGILGAVILLLKSKEDYFLYNLFLSIAQIASGLIVVALMFKKHNIKIVKVSIKDLIETYRSGFKVFASTILVTFFASYAFVLLKDFATEEELGIFSTANKITMTLQALILLPFSQAFFPHIAKIALSNIQKFTKQITLVAIVLILCTLSAALVIHVFAKEIILLVFGETFLNSTNALKVYIFLPVLSTLTNLFAYQGLLSLHKDKLFLKIHIVFTICIIASSYLVIPTFGAMGAIYLRIISEGLLMICSLFFLWKVLKQIR